MDILNGGLYRDKKSTHLGILIYLETSPRIFLILFYARGRFLETKFFKSYLSYFLFFVWVLDGILYLGDCLIFEGILRELKRF